MTACHDCDVREATVGALCVECFVEVASQMIRVFDILVDLATVAGERGHRIVLEPAGGGGWNVYLGPAHLDIPLTFATGPDLLAALEGLQSARGAAPAGAGDPP